MRGNRPRLCQRLALPRADRPAGRGAGSAEEAGLSALLPFLLLAAEPTAVERLDRELLAATSATAVLQRHCDALDLPGKPRIRAAKDAARVREPSGLRKHLRITKREPIIHRRVALICGDRVFSRADNWYVPSRLTPDMNAALVTGDTPFGVVIRPLQPRRQPLSTGHSTGALFVHHAVVLNADGLPLAEVAETYQPALLEGVRAYP